MSARLCDCGLSSPSLFDGARCEVCNGYTVLPGKSRLASSRSGLLPGVDSQYDPAAIAKVYAFALPKPTRRKQDSWASECPSLRPSAVDLHSRSYSNLSAFQGFGTREPMNRTDGASGKRSPLFMISEYHKLLTTKQVEEDDQDEDVKPRKPHDSTIHLSSGLDSKGSSRASTSHETSQSPSFSTLKEALKRPSRLVRSAAQTRSNSASGFYSDGRVVFSGKKQHRNGVNAIITNEDWTVTGASDYKVWKIKEECPVHTAVVREMHAPVMRLLAPSPKLLIAGCGGGELHLCDVETRALLRSETNEHSRSITGLAQQSPSAFLSSSLDSSVKLWDLRNKRSIASFAGHCGAVQTVQLWDEFSFLSAGSDFTMRKWDFRTCATLQSWKTEEEVMAIARVRGFVVTAGAVIRVWGSDTQFSAGSTTRTLACISETDWLAGGSSDGSLHVWRI